jgi:hypothetical protein
LVTIGTSLHGPEQVRGEPLDQRADLFALKARPLRVATGAGVHRLDDGLIADAILNRAPPVQDLNPAAAACRGDSRSCSRRSRTAGYAMRPTSAPT